MTNPPPWNDPIKPPNGNFSLEERKWREGITRGLNNIKIKSLGDIGDVDLTSPSANEILKFDGSNWVNGTPSVTVTNWGDIVGSLSNQTDLQNALNAKADLLSLALVAITGSYNDLSDKPTIPTVNDATLTIQKNGTNVATFTANSSSNQTANISVPTDTNDLTNGAGYITSGDIPSGDLSSNSSVLNVTDGTGATLSNTSLTLDTDLSKYDNTTSDFVDSNDLATKQDVIDNNNPLSASYVSGLATVATSGDYDDLLNKPTIPTVNDAILTIQRNSTNVGTFTANASSNATIDITVPTDTNDLTNGAGYITSSALPTVNDATLTIQKNGTNIATFTANASSNATANISVPTDTSDLTNTAGFITGVSSINDIGDVTITTPSTGDLLKYNGSKWINGSPSTTVTNWGDILGTLSDQTDLQNALNDKQDVIDANNKLDYSLLSNTPTIPTVNDAILTLQQNGTTVGTFTANSSSNVNIDYPCDASHFIANSDIIPTANNAYSLGDNNSRYKESYINSVNSDTVLVGGLRLGSGSQYNNTNCCFYPVTGNWVFFTGGIPTNAGGGFAPSEDNKLSCGHPSYKWNLVYSAGGVNTSDRDKKENIEEVNSGLDILNRLPIYSFTWKDDKPKYISYGMIAQEVLDVAPELVEVPEGYKEGDGSLGLYTNNVLFLAVKAIQELSDKVTALENKLESLGV